MSRHVLCEASEKGAIIVNECLKRGLQINTMKLEQLLILMHARMLTLYKKPFFKQQVIVREHALMIDEVDEDFRIYAFEFKEVMEEYICLLEKEEEVMNYIIDNYGELDFFDLRDSYVLKKLREHYKDLFSLEEQHFDILATPYDDAFIIKSDKTEEFKTPNKIAKQEKIQKKILKK